MKKFTFALMLGMTTLFAVSCMQSAEKKDAPAQDSTAKTDSTQQQAAAMYVCPMHPEVTSATPAKCSVCGMDLVKK